VLRFIGVICDRTAPPLRAGACGSAGREFAMLRAWREDHPPAALGKDSASPALDQPQPKWRMAFSAPRPTAQMRAPPFVSMLRSPRRQWDDGTRRTYEIARTAPADNANPFSRMLRVHSTPPNGRPDDVLDRDLSRPLDGLKLSSSCAMVGVTRKVRAKLAPRREQSMRRRPPYSGWFVKLWQRSSV